MKPFKLKKQELLSSQLQIIVQETRFNQRTLANIVKTDFNSKATKVSKSMKINSTLKM
jgi:hypothetical protein